MCRGCGKMTGYSSMFFSPILRLDVPLCKACTKLTQSFTDMATRRRVLCVILYVHFSWLSYSL
jgi:hypothetical protein